MDAKYVAEGILDSLSSIPGTMYRGLKRSYITSGALTSERRMRNEAEDERFFRAVKAVINNQDPLRRLILIVLEAYVKKSGQAGRDALERKVSFGIGHVAGKSGGQMLMAYTITNIILMRMKGTFLYKRFVKWGTTATLNALMFEGLLEEAALASRRMQNHYSQIYYQVHPLGLDMIYFLVEDQLKPYLEYLKGQPNFCKRVDNELSQKIR